MLKYKTEIKHHITVILEQYHLCVELANV